MNLDLYLNCTVLIKIHIYTGCYLYDILQFFLQSLTVKLESSSAVPLSPPRSPVTSCTTDCGWNVLPETPSTGEGAGFYLMFCCRCVPIDKDQPHPVITCVEYSSKYGMLVQLCVCLPDNVFLCLFVCLPVWCVQYEHIVLFSLYTGCMHILLYWL